MVDYNVIKRFSRCKISASRAKSQIYLRFSETPPNFEGAALNIVQVERNAKFICAFEKKRGISQSVFHGFSVCCSALPKAVDFVYNCKKICKT